MAAVNQVGNALTGSTGTGAFVGQDSPTLNTPIIAQIDDVNGNAELGFIAAASAVNYLQISNAASLSNVGLTAVGSDSNIGMTVAAKGTGTILFESEALTNQYTFYSGTGNQHGTNFNFPATAASQIITFPDASGTIALTSGASGIVNAGSINQLAWYAANGTTVSGLATANNGVLVTSAGGVPSISSTLPAGLTIPTPIINQINDTNGNTIIDLSPVASAVNYLQIINAATTGTPSIDAVGSDTNVGITISAQNAGVLTLQTTAVATQLSINTGTALQHNTTFSFANTAASRVVTFPDADGTLLMTGQAISTVPSIAFSSTSGVIGTTTNDSAAAGSVGEYVSSTIAVASAVPLATGTPANITSISLTAGDWQIWGNVGVTVADGTAVSATGWISATSATQPDGSLRAAFAPNGAFFTWSNAVPTLRASLSGTTTYYLSAQYVSGGTAGTGYGGIYARRLR